MATKTETKRVPALKATVRFDPAKPEEDAVVFTFPAIEREFTITPAGMDPAIIRQAVLHGLKQKIGDAAALSVNPDTGRSATVEEKFAAALAVFNRLVGDGDHDPAWNAERGEGGAVGLGLLFRALCRVYATKSPEFVREFLAGKTPAEQAALRAHPKIAPVIEAIKAEDAARKPAAQAVDTDSLLAGLEDGDAGNE